MPPLLIALRKDGAPTSVPPPPPDHVAPSADRPIGPSAGADLTSVRLSACCVAPRTTLHYSLAHSLTPIPCSMLDRSKSVARGRSRPASLPPPSSRRSRRSLLFPHPASRAAALSFQTAAAVARHYPTQTLLPIFCNVARLHPAGKRIVVPDLPREPPTCFHPSLCCEQMEA